MEDLHGYYVEDLSEGMSASFGKTVTDADIVLFAGISGDTNPVHLNDDFAKKTMFKGRIAHGIFGASLISAVLGTKLPGPGCIYVNQTLRFKAPVRAGETLIASVTVKSINAAKKLVTLDTVCTVDDKTVIEGEAVLMVPSKG
ncbi:MAG: MaoC family dehydratase [Rhodospirillales bacterium]|nr:MAG: MaoC family dehydratase [Rhodospirillales bacterium]